MDFQAQRSIKDSLIDSLSTGSYQTTLDSARQRSAEMMGGSSITNNHLIKTQPSAAAYKAHASRHSDSHISPELAAIPAIAGACLHCRLRLSQPC